MNLSSILFASSGVLYLISFILHLLSFSGNEKISNRVAFGFLRVGFLLATFFFVSEAIDHGAFLPVLNMSQAMGFFAWSLAFVYLVFLIRIQTESFGLILSPILCLLTFIGVATLGGQATELPAWSAQLNPYFKLHIMSAFFAYASFTLSFAAGILYLIQNHELKSKNPGAFYHRLPSLVELEELISRPLLWGVPLLAVTIGVGFFWSKSVYGEYWIFDPKTIATIITACLYLGIIYMRSVAALRGKQFAVLSLFAFGLVLFSFVGIRFIEGSHNYLQ